MTVPFSDAVAKRVPDELMERKDIGALCACMTLATVSERVENRRTSPDCCTSAEDVGCTPEACGGSGDAGDGTGDGYAR